MIVSPKPLEALITSATLRLDTLTNTVKSGPVTSMALPMQEIGVLYKLFLELAEEIKKLQVEHNRLFGEECETKSEKSGG